MLAVEDVARSGNTDALRELIEQLHEQNRESIKLLHAEIHELKEKIDEMESGQVIVDRRLTKLDSTPIEVDKIRFPPRVVVAIVASVMAVVGGMYATNYGVRSDVRDILTTMANQKQLDEAEKRLDAERSANLRESIEAMKRRQELQQYEIQGLKEAILKGGK